MVDITVLIESLITLIGAIISCFVVPYLKQKMNAQKYASFIQVVSVAVACAEQVFDKSEGEAKKAQVTQYVTTQLAAKGLKFSAQEIDVAIEAEVLKLHKQIQE